MAGRMLEPTGEGGPDWLQLPGTHILLEKMDGCPTAAHHAGAAQSYHRAGHGQVTELRGLYRSAPGMSFRELGGRLSLEKSEIHRPDSFLRFWSLSFRNEVCCL